MECYFHLSLVMYPVGTGPVEPSARLCGNRQAKPSPRFSRDQSSNWIQVGLLYLSLFGGLLL